MVGATVTKHERHDANWDKTNLARNYILNIITQFGAAMLSFVIVWVISRYSGTEILAVTVAVTAGSQTILLFVNWTSVSVMRLGTEEFLRTKIISNTFSARTALLAFNLGLIVLLYPLWVDYFLNLLKLPPEAGYYLLVQFTLVSLIAHFTAGFQAVKLLRMQGILLFADKFISLSLILIFYAIYGKLGWHEIMVAYLCSSATILTASFFLLKGYYTFRWDRNYFWQTLRFALPLLPYSLTAFLTTNYLDTFFISRYLEKNDLGVYSVAYQFYGFWLQLPTILGTLVLPMFITYLVQDKFAVIDRFLERQLHIVVLIWSCCSAVCAGVLSWLLPHIFTTISHPQFTNIIITFILGTAFAIPNFIGYSPYSMAKKIVFFSFPLAIITAGTNFFGNRFLIERFGLVGSTYASVLSMAAGFIAFFLFMQFYFKVNTSRTLLAMLPAAAGILLFFYNVPWLVVLAISFGLSAGLIGLFWNDFIELLPFVKNVLLKRNRLGN